MNIYYVEIDSEIRDWYEYERTTLFHIIHAHNEDWAKTIFRRHENECRFVGEWTVAKVGESDRQRQGIASSSIEHELLHEYWMQQERDS